MRACGTVMHIFFVERSWTSSADYIDRHGTGVRFEASDYEPNIVRGLQAPNEMSVSGRFPVKTYPPAEVVQ